MKDDKKKLDLIKNKELKTYFYYLRKPFSRIFKGDQMTELNGKN